MCTLHCELDSPIAAGFSFEKMSSIPIYILPGLDGTDLLLQRFVELAPSETLVQVIPLADDPDANYDSLVEEVLKVIGAFVPCHIIAESFSGPIGILLARRFPEVVCRLTLVSSFAQSPTPSFAKFVPWKLLFRMPMPNFVANRYFLGSESALAPMLRKAIGTTSVATLARRIRCVMKVNVSQELSEIACPIDYVWPSNDRLVPLWSVRNILKINPRTFVIPIHGPHLIMQTRPKETWKGILNRPLD